MLGHAEMSTTQIYTQMAIRQLQLVHASTHPGARRRLRASQTALDVPAPHPDPKNAAEAFLQALADEADADEDGDQADLHP